MINPFCPRKSVSVEMFLFFFCLKKGLYFFPSKDFWLIINGPTTTTMMDLMFFFLLSFTIWYGIVVSVSSLFQSKRKSIKIIHSKIIFCFFLSVRYYKQYYLMMTKQKQQKKSVTVLFLFLFSLIVIWTMWNCGKNQLFKLGAIIIVYMGIIFRTKYIT